MSIYLAAIVGYFVLLVLIGVWQSRGAATGDDFLVAGRSLPVHVLVFTLLSTWIGAGTLFGGAGLGYRIGLPALWQSAGAWLGIALVFVLAARVRRLARYTVPDILELEYGTTARLLGTLTIVLAYTTIAAYQFRGGGRLLSLAAGIDPRTGAAVTAGCAVLCTVLAGMIAVARLDLLNGLVMLGGAAGALVYLSGQTAEAGAALAPLRPDQLTIFGALPPRDALALFLPTLFLLVGDANMYQKLFSARDGQVARRAVAGWIVATILLETLIVSIGMLGSQVVPGLDAADSETIVVRVAIDVLPTVLGVLLLAGAAAIVVSTANSMLLTPATGIARDLYQRFLNPAASDRQMVACTRVAVVVLAAVGLVFGSFFPTILAMALWAYTMYGAGITPALVAVLLWPSVSRRAGVWSMVAGLTVTAAWELAGLLRATPAAPAYPLGIQTIYPALIASVGTLLAITLLSAARREDIR